MSVPSFGVKQNKSSAERLAISNITKLIRKQGIVSEQIMVTELQCYDPNCVPLETLIILLKQFSGGSDNGIGDRWSTKVLKPLVEVTEEDIVQALGEYIKPPIPAVEETWRDRIKLLVGDIRKDPAVDQASLKSFLKSLADEIPSSSSSVTAAPTITRVPMQSRIDDGPAGPKAVPSAIPPSSSSVTRVPMMTNSEQRTASAVPSSSPPPRITYADSSPSSNSNSANGRHPEGAPRQRACPCCDPDNIDNVIDKLLFDIR